MWQAAVSGSGYGAFQLDGRCEKAHRIAWMLEVGEIPDGLCVLHHCDVPLCVNPGHLFLGTPGDNVRDCVSKSRNVPGAHVHPEIVRGVRNQQAKLKDETVRAIRALYSRGLSHRELARRFGVSKPVVTKVLLRQTWKHVA